MSKDQSKPAATAGLGPIEAGAIYPLEVFRQRAGLDAWAMRQARRAGLRVIKVGRRSFISGSDFAAYLSTIKS